MSDYPSESDLGKITRWTGTLQELITFVQSIWWYDPPVLRKGRSSFDRKLVFKLEVSTWGWSGNEDIMGELQSTMFWIVCWRLSKRGGHYEFEINPTFMDAPNMVWGDPHTQKDNTDE